MAGRGEQQPTCPHHYGSGVAGASTFHSSSSVITPSCCNWWCRWVTGQTSLTVTHSMRKNVVPVVDLSDDRKSAAPVGKLLDNGLPVRFGQEQLTGHPHVVKEQGGAMTLVGSGALVASPINITSLPTMRIAQLSLLGTKPIGPTTRRSGAHPPVRARRRTFGVPGSPEVQEVRHVDSGTGRSRTVLLRPHPSQRDSKTPTSSALAREPRRRLLAARFRDYSRPRLAYSERTPSVPGCQYPVRINMSIAARHRCPFPV